MGTCQSKQEIQETRARSLGWGGPLEEVFKGLKGAGGSISKHNQQVSVCLCMDLSKGPLASFTTPWLAFPRANGPREQKRSHRVLYDPISHCRFHSIPLVIQVSLLQSGRRYESMRTRRQGSAEVIFETGYHRR